MRCPKCGYISFDYLDTCLKCKKNIKNVSDALQGSVYNAAAPSFLEFDDEFDQEEAIDLETFEDEVGGIEIEDSALAVLLQDDSEEDADTLESIEDTELSSDFFDNIEEDLDEQDLDGEEAEEFPAPVAEMADESELMDSALSEETFASVDALETVATDENEDDDSPMLRVDFPEELNDISDLAPDAGEPREDFVEQPPAELSDDDSFDLDTDFNLDLGSLDLHDMPEPAALSSSNANLDDLDFELDLEGLSFGDK